MNHNTLPLTTPDSLGGYETPEAMRDAQKSLAEWNASVSSELEARQERAQDKKGLLKRIGGRVVSKLIQVKERRQAKNDLVAEQAFVDANKENPVYMHDARFTQFWNQEQLAKTNPYSEAWDPDSVPAGQSANFVTRQRDQQQVADFRNTVGRTGRIDMDAIPTSMDPNERRFYENVAASGQRIEEQMAVREQRYASHPGLKEYEFQTAAQHPVHENMRQLLNQK